MTQAGDKFRKELDMFLLKEGSDITQEDWISILSALVANLENRKSIDAFMDSMPFDIRAYMKDNLSKEPFEVRAK
ncbi:hypothetical protein [Campylobacter concisus]|jgi:hypothetical protein|uniref:hypothetical protein n=1 Tax=Campylobacter concisus TaxID=199 RepID=UPI000CD7E274|nr:hypothetical protein [Campylobacter concisus]